MRYWAIFDGDVLVRQVITDGDQGTSDFGHSIEGLHVVETARQIDERFEVINPTTGAITTHVEQWDAIGESLIDRAYEQKVQTVSSAPAKAAEHTRKRHDAEIYQNSNPPIVSALLQAEADLAGITVAQLVAAILEAAQQEREALDAFALGRRQAITQLRQATTLEAKAQIVQTYIGG